MSLALDVEPQGMVDKAGDALGFLDNRVRGDLERFKDFVEGRGGATGGWRGRLRPTDSAGVGPSTSTSTDTGKREFDRPGPYPGPLPSHADEEPRV
ncbi:hypothetical protein ACFW96_20465 [Streptomyces gardneri]|uniref:hypothetical protein n=1 Tax=Streptomyces gardneri TaxID=66892 RepID=UPI00367D8178